MELTNRLNMSEIISTSVSAAAIFCSELILGGPPKRKDILAMRLDVRGLLSDQTLFKH